MINAYERSHLRTSANINYALLALYLTISISCHALANRLILIGPYPLFGSALAYMAIYVLTDVFASYNKRRLVIYFIFLEAFANFFFLAYSNFIIHLPYPTYFHYAKAYREVFSPVMILYFANLIGTIISSLIDLYFFYFFYYRLKIFFLGSTLLSSVITISCYTLITDLVGFRKSFPTHYWDLTVINIASNFVTLVLFAIVAQVMVFFIHKALER